MVIERIMAESTPSSGSESPSIIITNASGVQVGEHSVPELTQPKPPEDPLISLEDLQMIEEQIRREGGSQFVREKVFYNHLMGLPIPDDSVLNDQLQWRKVQSKEALERLEQTAEIHPAQPLREARKEMLRSYKRIKETRAKEIQGRGRDHVIDEEAAMGPRMEGLLEESEEIAPLMSVIRGLIPYLWEGVRTKIAYEEKGIVREVKNPFAERLFALIKRQRARDRMSTAEKRYAQFESYWGGSLITIFAWPESSRDMIFTAMDWVKDKIAAIGERDPNTTNKLLEEIRGNGPMLLQNSLLRINSERALAEGEILETNPEYLRAIAFTEGPPDVFGNEKIMKKGNTEFGPQAKERFAAKFIENFNAMFLENRFAAYLMHGLRTYKDGTYWTGHDWHMDKVEEGDIKDYRAKIQEELTWEAAPRDFFTESVFVANQDLFSQEPREGEEDVRLIRSKEDEEDVRLAYSGFFELRDKYKLQYSANDPLERLLLDPGGVIRQRIATTGDAEALRRHNLRVAVFRRTKELLDRREGFDFISKVEIYKLEKRMRRPLSDEELTDLAEVHKDILRAQLRQGLADPDSEQSKRWIESQIVVLRESNRQESIKNRIRAQMEEISKGKSYFAESSATALAQFDKAKQDGDSTKCDQVAWEWVKNYNSNLIKSHLPKWYPSGWDKVRIKIDRAAKVIDRSLTEEEREAMYERAYLPEVAEGDEEGKARVEDLKKGRMEDARFGFELARSFSIFLMESSLLGGMRIRMVMKKGPHAGEYIGRLDDNETSVLLGLIKGRINPQTREVEVERDANGEAIIIDPERKSLRILDVVEARLAKAIGDEDHEIGPLKLAKCQALKAKYKAELSGNQAEIAVANQALEKAAKDLREKLADSQFVVTHAFKTKGLASGRWPVWPHAVLDNSMIKGFGEILAEYGVEIAPGLPFADYKKEIYEYLERGRRGQFAEMDRATQEFMEGRYPFYERDYDGNIITDPVLDDKGQPKKDIQGNTIMAPRPAVSIFTMSNDWGEPGPMDDRMRVVNKGDVAENTMVTEAEYNMSSSGGVKFTEYISHARLNFFPLGIWGLGAPGIWDLNNFIKGRNEVEYHKQRFLDPTDMPKNAKAQAAAYIARKALTGGSLGEGKFTPGFLMEPFHGAWQVADWFRKYSSQKGFGDLGMENCKKYVLLMTEMREGRRSPNDEELERVRQLTYKDWTALSSYKEMSDDLYQTVGKVFDYFTTWLQAEKEVEQNRIGNAPRNWTYDNTKRWYAFRREIRKSLLKKGGAGIVDRLGYSREAASEISLKMVETMLMDGDYLILRDYERERLAQEGSLILSKVLNDDEKKKGLSLLDETTWRNQRPEVRKALETARRRGLLDFMKEEGFSWYTKLPPDQQKGQWQYKRDELQYIGERVPEEVRKEVLGVRTINFKDMTVMRYAA